MFPLHDHRRGENKNREHIARIKQVLKRSRRKIKDFIGKNIETGRVREKIDGTKEDVAEREKEAGSSRKTRKD